MEDVRKLGNVGNVSGKARISVKQLATMGLLMALSATLVYFIHFPFFPVAAKFLEYDPADIPVLIGTMAYGPLAGLILTVAVSGIQTLFISPQSGPQGFLMHVIATGAMVIVVGNIFKRSRKTRKAMALALAVGAVAMVIGMVVANLIVTPYFMEVDISVVKGMLIPIIIPFNLLKGGINAYAAYFVAKVMMKNGLFNQMK